VTRLRAGWLRLLLWLLGVELLRQKAAAWQTGYDTGEENGYQSGYGDGWRHGAAEVEAELVAKFALLEAYEPPRLH
jgi:hypothetical protein